MSPGKALRSTELPGHPQFSEEEGTVAHKRLLDPLRLSDPLFVFKFSTSVVFTERLNDKGDSFWKDLSLFFW